LFNKTIIPQKGEKTEAETARVLGVNRITVWRWIRLGKFDAQKIGREVIIPKWEVELIRTKGKNVRRTHN